MPAYAGRRDSGGRIEAFVSARAAVGADGRFRFLQRLGEANWHSQDQERLWLYNLHYFDYLRAAPSARQIVDDWIARNPCPVGTGWEPYPLSRRIVNWCHWLIEETIADERHLRSLAQQTAFLSRHMELDVRANHLFANAKALLTASLVLDTTDGDRWRRQAERHVFREFQEQFYRDGGHVERSPMYHAVVLHDILDIINVGRGYGWPGVAAFEPAVPAMLAWLSKLSRGKGGPMHFHDSVGGIAPDFSELSRYARRLGIESGSTDLSDSGYVQMHAGPVRLTMDAGGVAPPYQPGHAHAQALCIEVEVEDTPVFVNSGTSTYEQGALRAFQRSTRAHNTVEIDERDSAEVWSVFRVGRRPNVRSWRSRHGIVAEHDGYRFLPGRPRHRRKVVVDETGFTVEDEVLGSGRHKILATWLLHPEIVLRPSGKELLAGETLLKVAVSGPVKTTFDPAEYWPTFGPSVSTNRLVCTWEGELPFRCSLRVDVFPPAKGQAYGG